MRRFVALITLGALLGFVTLAAGPPGLLVSIFAAVAAYKTSPQPVRVQSGGVLLASASFTAVALGGNLLLNAASDPAIGLAPGTLETFVAACILGLIGVSVAIVGARRGGRTHIG